MTRASTVLATAAVLLSPAAAAAAAPATLAADVCAVYCDTRDPSQARQEAFPVPEVSINGRRLVLHVSDVDAMAWGSIDNGTVGDSVWLDLTRDPKYLNMAVTIANYVHGYWDTSRCGGGVWWDRERTYKNAVTTGLYIRLTAALHNRLPGDTTWLNRATTGWTWFSNSGMINSAELVNDGLTASCANNGQTVWTYNQGLAIGGAVELWRATGNAALLASARQLADAAINSPALTRDGILTESCDGATSSCDDNQKQFKGIFMRNLMDLADATGASSYRTYAQRQADTIWQADRDPLNRIGQRWSGQSSSAYPNARDWRTQASGLGAVLAATANP